MRCHCGYCWKVPKRNRIAGAITQRGYNTKNWNKHCGMTAVKQFGWEEKADDLAKAICLLLNSKNKAAKKDLRLAYAQGNHSSCPKTMEKMVRFLLP